MSLLAYGLVALALLGAIGGIGYKVHHAGYIEGKGEIQQLWDNAVATQKKDEQDKSAAASLKVEDGNAKAKVVYRTITKSVDRYIDRPVYRNVCFDADGLLDANAALVGKTGADSGKPDKPMPAANPTR